MAEKVERLDGSLATDGIQSLGRVQEIHGLMSVSAYRDKFKGRLVDFWLEFGEVSGDVVRSVSLSTDRVRCVFECGHPEWNMLASKEFMWDIHGTNAWSFSFLAWNEVKNSILVR